MWSQLKMLVAGLARDDSGQTLVEYALILLLVAVALVGALVAFRGVLIGAFTGFATTLAGL